MIDSTIPLLTQHVMQGKATFSRSNKHSNFNKERMEGIAVVVPDGLDKLLDNQVF